MSITHSGTEILFDGFETGDNLRAYIASNGLGVVTGREAFLDASIGPASTTAQFEDSNCTWVFRGPHHWDFQQECAIFKMTDGVIIYSEQQKGHTTQPRAAILTLKNVHYRTSVGSGRSDFFGPGAVQYDLSNIHLISYGGSNFLHLSTNGGLLKDISIKVGSGGLTFQPSCTPGNTLIMRNTVLDAVSAIIPNSGGDITSVTRLENLTWETNDTWSISGASRGQTYVIVNPNKHATWTGYSGQRNASNDTYEVHTHNVRLVDENNTPIDGAKVQLRRADGTTLVYDLVTDSNGDIPEQEVVTYDQAAGSNVWTQYGDFIFGAISYNNAVVSAVKPLQDGRIDEVVTAILDASITETDPSVVAAWTTINSPTELYDRYKLYLLNNYAGESETAVKLKGDTAQAGAKGDTTYAGSYGITIDPAASQAFALTKGEFTATGTVSLAGDALTGTGTAFLSELRADMELKIDGRTFFVKTITNDTSAIVSSNTGADIAAGTSMLAYDGNITIKTTFFVGNIETTGPVAIQGGAAIQGGVISSAGNGSISFDSGVGIWELYARPDQMPMDGRANPQPPLASGTGSDSYPINTTATPENPDIFYFLIYVEGLRKEREVRVTGPGIALVASTETLTF